MYSEDEAARHPNQTYWENKTDRVVKVTLRMGPKTVVKDKATGRPVVKDPGVRHYVWQPGEGLWLSSEHDNAIQVVDSTQSPSMVVSGHAPQLTKDGGDVELHPALDVEGQRQKAAEKAALEALDRQAAANTALLIAASQMKPHAPSPEAKHVASHGPPPPQAEAKHAKDEGKRKGPEAP